MQAERGPGHHDLTWGRQIFASSLQVQSEGRAHSRRPPGPTALCWSKGRAGKVGLGGGFNLHEDGLLGGRIQNTATWKQLVAPHPGHLSMGSARPHPRAKIVKGVFFLSSFIHSQQTRTKAFLSSRFRGFKAHK